MEQNISSNSMHSSSIAKIAEALSKAQSNMMEAEKDGANPFHKSKYMTLSSVWDACRQPLSSNGLAIVQTIEIMNDKNCLVTTLMHSSGEWIKSCLPLLMSKQDSQSMGSAITYSRRYALCAMVGICPADDDGEIACGRLPEKMIAKINEEQCAQIDLIDDEAGKQHICNTLNLKSIYDMPSSEFNRTIKWFDKRREASNAKSKSAS